MSLVTVGLVTWNSAPDIARCLDAIRGQSHTPIEVLVGDNASVDETRPILERVTAPDERRYFATNLGFSAAHNALIRASRGEFYLSLNPDVVLDPAFVARLVEALACPPACRERRRQAPPAGAVRRPRFDGIVMRRSQRHLDRGADEPDRGQYERQELVFGVTGAAGFYRRAMLEDIQIEGEYFDEDFFAYREDADLAWRAQLFGWDCLYVPDAQASHLRRVTPERREALPPEVNRYSVRNRFLLRLKNQTADQALRFAGPTLVRDLQVVGYVLLREWGSIGGLADVVRLLPSTWRKRRAIMRRRTRPSAELARWFDA